MPKLHHTKQVIYRLGIVTGLVCFLSLPLGCTSKEFSKNLDEAGKEMSILFKKVKNDVKNIAADIKEATRTNTAGNDEDSPELSIASFTVSPHKVRKGGQVTVKVRYIVRGARKDGLTITESKHLLYNNQTTASLDSKKVKRENGTWESTTSFKVPRSAKTGKYKIKQSIIVDDGTNLQSLGYFTVTQ